MRGVAMHAPGDVRVEHHPEIVEPTDAIVRLAATCIPVVQICGPIEASRPSSGRRPWVTSTPGSFRG
jgi:hypothetical protein